jgi:hypothetical protein
MRRDLVLVLYICLNLFESNKRLGLTRDLSLESRVNLGPDIPSASPPGPTASVATHGRQGRFLRDSGSTTGTYGHLLTPVETCL